MVGNGGSVVVIAAGSICSASTDFSWIDSLALVAVAAVLFSVTTVAVLIVLSLGTKVAPKWAEKQVFFY